ncbi:homoserine dehydrogenase [Thermoactinomyces mirandus]|uniref:Homoserine dehydrogenase n=1 Tax=Thermoactinomyces mirandus TaxID=2756294 RepID=A0A7W1XQV8_9BACL|nr:homoserine dehydrogenase [Thermoactinomyces mirandus]MBA4601517.1 homoserine dehydrogenase [Thermoactinomyces mirandus]
MMEKVKVALLGLGTVGSGVWKMISENRDVIARKTGKWYQISSVLVKNPEKKRNLDGVEEVLTTDFSQVLARDPDVLIEVIGGVEPAFSYIKKAMAKGCHIVTANKELMAKRGQELEELSGQYGVQLRYEASVGGGIPVISTIRHFLKANRIYRFYGILNGTTNYILTRMSEEACSFADVLKDAQEKGYAEADPSSDVEGLDAVYKLSILMRLAFQVHVPVSQIPCQGITDLSPQELQLAEMLGYSVKLLARAEQFGENGPVSCSVLPTLVPLHYSLASVRDVYNAVTIEGDYVQDLTFVGQGAGQKPTASAVVEDLLNTGISFEEETGCQTNPWVLAGEDVFLTRFMWLKVRGQVTKPALEAQLKEVFASKLLRWAMLPEQAHTSIGLIVQGCNEQERKDWLSRWDVEQSQNRPVLVGKTLLDRCPPLFLAKTKA